MKKQELILQRLKGILHIFSFSGGKDSLATILKMKGKINKSNMIVVFCDVKWEHSLTYQYIDDIIKELDLVENFIVLTDKKNLGFEGLVRFKKRFPSATVRFCTSVLKIEPMIDFILDNVKQHSIIYQGIRHEESAERSKMNEQCTYFKYYFEPYDRNDWKLERLLNKKKQTIADIHSIKKLQEKISKGILEPKFYTYRKKDVIKYCQIYNTDVERPVIYMTAKEVIHLILDNELKPNPLYYLGSGRVGCYPCIYVTKSELWQIIINDYWVIEKIALLEKECGTTFFTPDYIPKRYHSGRMVNKHGESVTYCFIEDVVKYLMDINSKGNLFKELEEEENKQRSCMSAFNICER